MRKGVIRSVFCIACIALSFSGEAGDNGPYAILESIPTPVDLLKKRFPPAYRVPVTLAGHIADEMARTLKEMGLADPEFEELLKRKGRTRLVVVNKEYPGQTSELISGILNPTEMINGIIQSLLRFQSKEQFEMLKNETVFHRRSLRFKDKEAVCIELTPRGERFGYSYEDMGTYINEEWLSRLSVVIDEQKKHVYEITARRHTRNQTIKQTDKPVIKTQEMRYLFSYVPIEDMPAPAGLDLYLDSNLTLSIAATYRKAEKYIVFDTRSICHRKTDNDQNCLTMNYGAYEFSLFGPRVAKKESKNYAGKLAKAAGLSRKAAQHIEKGEIAGALRVYKKIIDDFPETPHAVEARELIRSIP
ncbi:MAG: hypothetical protein GF401_00310 [Chitinivibrionales bacterium]|nr:hypothetical protein [Chitinivibrionales bacterium]